MKRPRREVQGLSVFNNRPQHAVPDAAGDRNSRLWGKTVVMAIVPWVSAGEDIHKDFLGTRYRGNDGGQSKHPGARHPRPHGSEVTKQRLTSRKKLPILKAPEGT